MAFPEPVPDANTMMGVSTTAAKAHHSLLWAELTMLEKDLLTAVADVGDFGEAQTALVEFLRREVSAHLEAEHAVLHSAARIAGAHALVDSLDLDHKALIELIERLDQASTGLEAAAAAQCVAMLFALRMEKEENLLLPLLRDAGTDVEALLAGEAEITGAIPERGRA